MLFLGIDEGSHSYPSRPHVACKGNINVDVKVSAQDALLNKGNNKITELRTILQRESQNS